MRVVHRVIIEDDLRQAQESIVLAHQPLKLEFASGQLTYSLDRYLLTVEMEAICDNKRFFRSF
jgi:hypothetical protein